MLLPRYLQAGVQEGGGTEGEMLRPQLLPERVCTLPPRLEINPRQQPECAKAGWGPDGHQGGTWGWRVSPAQRLKGGGLQRMLSCACGGVCDPWSSLYPSMNYSRLFYFRMQKPNQTGGTG